MIKQHTMHTVLFRASRLRLDLIKCPPHGWLNTTPAFLKGKVSAIVLQFCQCPVQTPFKIRAGKRPRKHKSLCPCLIKIRPEVTIH